MDDQSVIEKVENAIAQKKDDIARLEEALDLIKSGRKIDLQHRHEVALFDVLFD